MAAFSASRLVCSAMSSMVSTTAPIFWPSTPSSRTLLAAWPTTTWISVIAAVVSRTAWPPCSAAIRVCWPAVAIWVALAATCFDAGRHLGGGGAGGLDLAGLVGGAAGDAVDDLAELADGGGRLLR